MIEVQEHGVRSGNDSIRGAFQTGIEFGKAERAAQRASSTSQSKRS